MNAIPLTVEQRTLALGVCSVFASMPAGDLALLAEMMQTERFLAGELLFEYGDPSDRVFMVVTGGLAVYPQGRVEAARILGQGQLFGEYGMLMNLARTATVKAESDAVVLSLDYERFHEFLLRCPQATLVLLRSAVDRLVEAERRTRSQPEIEPR